MNKTLKFVTLSAATVGAVALGASAVQAHEAPADGTGTPASMHRSRHGGGPLMHWLTATDEQRAVMDARFEAHLADLPEEQQAIVRQHHASMSEHHQQMVTEFTGLSGDEIKSRLEAGETWNDILESAGKTRQEWRDYVQQQREAFRAELEAQGVELPDRPEGAGPHGPRR